MTAAMSNPSADAATLLNIEHARTYRGRPIGDSLVPYQSAAHVLACRAQESPAKTFIIHYDEAGQRGEITYGEFAERVGQVANYLAHALGVKHGDRVATIGYNHLDTVLIYFACWQVGACLAPQNVTEDDARIAFILRSSHSVVVFARDAYMARAQKIIAGGEAGLGASNVRHLVQVGGSPSDQHPHFDSAIATQPSTFVAAEPPTRTSEALLVYTSGTTGAPKGVLLSHYNMLADARAISDWQGITGNQRLMCVLPIHHVNGIIVTLVTPLYVGASLVLNRAFSTSTFWARIAQEQVNVVSVVPTLLQFCCEYAETQLAAGKSIWGDSVSRADLGPFRHLICGAGTLSVVLVKRFQQLFGFRVLHGYGLSETTCYSCYLPVDLSTAEHDHWLYDHGYPSIGCPIEGNEMAIFDAEGSGQTLGPGQRGEICIRGHNVMKYYDQRPDANRETFRFGWFRSGDEGFFLQDAQGRPFFFITGRLKELINRGGVKFSPFEIEEVLLRLPGVKVGLAIAFENDYYGEEVGAYIVPEPEAALDANVILAECRRQMGFEKAPKVVIFGTEIPVTTTGKYQRLRLRDLFAAHKGTQFRA
jgi:long-chain acyl-CoA synthetase